MLLAELLKFGAEAGTLVAKPLHLLLCLAPSAFVTHDAALACVGAQA